MFHCESTYFTMKGSKVGSRSTSPELFLIFYSIGRRISSRRALQLMQTAPVSLRFSFLAGESPGPILNITVER
jgi:hypothetical protein